MGRDSLEIMVPSLQRLLRYRKMSVPVFVGKELLYVLSLTMAAFSKSVHLTIAGLELFGDVVVMNELHNGYGFLGSFFRFLVILKVIGYLVAKKHIIPLSSFEPSFPSSVSHASASLVGFSKFRRQS